jgi:ribosomal protein L29
MQMGSGQGVRASEVRETRKNIARIKTVMKENEQGKNTNG